jgi:hypothetical protein
LYEVLVYYILNFIQGIFHCFAVNEYVIFFAGKFKPVIKKAMVELEGIYITKYEHIDLEGKGRGRLIFINQIIPSI